MKPLLRQTQLRSGLLTSFWPGALDCDVTDRSHHWIGRLAAKSFMA